MTVEQTHTYCAMCVSRCGVVATVENGRFTKVNADVEHPNAGICVKGTAAPEVVYSPDRIRYPMLRTRPKGDPEPGWTRISWEDAMSMIASRLLELKARHGAEAVAFPIGTPAGGGSGDFIHWVVRLANAFGSPNLVANTYICQWHRDTGARYTYGVGTPRPDIEHTRCMLLWGLNPQATWPTMAIQISRARATGAKLVVIDPRETDIARKADVWLRVRPGADGALALSMIHVLLEEKLYDEAFVREWTNGGLLVRDDTNQLLRWQDLAAESDTRNFVVWDLRIDATAEYAVDSEPNVAPALTGTYQLTLANGTAVTCRPVLEVLTSIAARYAPELAKTVTWVPAEDVRRAVRLFVREKPSCYYTYTGLEQHSDSMHTNRAVCVFYALTGQFDQRGSNVLFAGAPASPVMGLELLSRNQASRRLGYAERPLGPAATGWTRPHDVYRAILTGQPYPIKAMLAFGFDPLVGHADPLAGKKALEALEFYVHVDLFANPSASFADILLPAASCWESAAVRLFPPDLARNEAAANWAQYRRAVVRPVEEARPDLDIIFDLARRLGLGDRFFGGDIEAAFNHQLAPLGLTVEQLREHPAGIRVPAETRYQKYREIDARTGRPRGFQTPTGKVEIFATSFAQAGYPPLPVVGQPAEHADDEEYPLALTFARLVQFVNDGHRNIPRLRRQVRDPLLEIHPDTASGLNIENGDWVIVETCKAAVTLKARLSTAVDPRVVVTQHGWWQACQELDARSYDPFGAEGANTNLLIDAEMSDPISGAVAHRSQRCRVRKSTLSEARPA